jgi:hypothetical protein
VIERIDFWGFTDTWHIYAYVVAYVLVPLCAVVMLARFYGRMRWVWKVGRPERRWDQPLTRLWRVVQYGIVQVKVLGQTYPGLMHVGIAWGFFVLFLGTALATINGHFLLFLRGGCTWPTNCCWISLYWWHWWACVWQPTAGLSKSPCA